MGLTEKEKTKAKEFLRRAKNAGYSGDVLFICGCLAFSKDNIGKEIQTLDQFMKFIDQYKDENKFLNAAMVYCGQWEQ